MLIHRQLMDTWGHFHLGRCEQLLLELSSSLLTLKCGMWCMGQKENVTDRGHGGDVRLCVCVNLFWLGSRVWVGTCHCGWLCPIRGLSTLIFLGSFQSVRSRCQQPPLQVPAEWLLPGSEFPLCLGDTPVCFLPL